MKIEAILPVLFSMNTFSLSPSGLTPRPRRRSKSPLIVNGELKQSDILLQCNQDYSIVQYGL